MRRKSLDKHKGLKKILKKTLSENQLKTLKKLTKSPKKTAPSPSSPKMVETINGRPVLTLREICNLLEVDIPKAFLAESDSKITETGFFKRLEESTSLLEELRVETANPEGYFTGLGSSPRRFKLRFQKSSGPFSKDTKTLIEMFVHWQFIFRERGFWFREYFDYRLYNCSIEEGEAFIGAGYRYEINEVCNSLLKSQTKIFSRKSLFNKKFAKHVQRDFLEIRKSSLADFEAFVQKHPRFFGKPLFGTGGFGAKIWEIGPEADLEAAYQQCLQENLIIEELVRQHPAIASINPSTLNTARIYSLLTADGEVVITLATIRFGRAGGNVDNFHSGGVGAAVNVETGEIYTEAVDMNGHRYAIHPDTQQPIKGFMIPNWDKAIAAVKDAALSIQENFGHIGWDVAFTEAGEIEFMEGNTIPNFHIPQVVDQVGKKYIYEPYLIQLRKKRLDKERTYLSDFIFEEKNNGMKLVKYEGEQAHIKIPDEYEGKPVTIIGARAFAGLSFIERIHIPESVGTIYREAFKGCTGLEKIELPQDLTVLNAEAFQDCRSLVTVGLPYDLVRICRSTFEGCVKLKSFYFYSKRGISDVMKTDRTLKEAQLPTLIDYIGERAFAECHSLKEVTIPYKVKVINQETFENCHALSAVHVHNLLENIKERAFAGCGSLKELKLPLILKKIGEGAFDPSTTLVGEGISYTAKFAAKNNLAFQPLLKIAEMPALSSQMLPYAKGAQIPLSQHQSFYTKSELEKVIEKYEMRRPSYKLVSRKASAAPQIVASARFDLVDGIYHNKNKTRLNQATIMMTGDLMSRYRQQVFVHQDGSYYFDDSFYFVKKLLAQSDFAIGNMETMISPSSPFTSEKEHVNARPHLNAPESFLGAIRNASFDAVVNAQNHVYDTGALGIMETLDMHNKYELMHTGAYASPADKRYLIVEVNQIKIAVVSYFDGARQLMKKANFTKIGRQVMLSIHEKEQIQRDMEAAKKEGAEFIIAYCHWGREYTEELTQRQQGFAQEVADAGADFIFGAHSHCVQPYGEIKSEDGRLVPVLFSGGNFLSDINIKPPITRDTLIMELQLEKDAQGIVRIRDKGYYPCRIEELGGKDKNYAVIPAQIAFSDDAKLTKNLLNADKRVQQVIGKGLKKLTPKTIDLEMELKHTPFADDIQE